MGQDEAGMGIYHTHPAPFNFLNGMGMIFILNKRDGVGMGATRPEPAPLPFLIRKLKGSYGAYKIWWYKLGLKPKILGKYWYSMDKLPINWLFHGIPPKPY